MRGPRSLAVVNKNLANAEMSKTKKAETKAAKQKGGKKKPAAAKDSAAPKRPAGAFFIFMEEFRKSFKENFPDNKSVSTVGKAGGEKWKSMSAAEKAPYVEMAMKRKADYEKALDEYKKKAHVFSEQASEKSTSEVHDDAESDISS